ncbi:thiosulfate sulfurtransferase/rhodanese-like domain-containing protein 3 isoform X1 [Pelobates fuscus]|uniref:thiosulfate sulfurtransferase/rhodanese-like domain-containing protein 3 isoform X1 n=1 Tax=Pelobates fuscus TaxID=191477 RepID=UPI002FE450C4
MSVWLSRLCVSVRSVRAQHVGSGFRRSSHSLAGPSIKLSRKLQYPGHSTRSSRQGEIRLIDTNLTLNLHHTCGFSTSVGKTIQYEELKNLVKEGVIHIDVREPWEVKEYGVIKGSINIPIGELVAALQMSPGDFEEKYHQKLPDKSDTVVFSCLAGIRSKKALDVASSLGFNQTYNYGGGFQDWARHEPPQKK